MAQKISLEPGENENVSRSTDKTSSDREISAKAQDSRYYSRIMLTHFHLSKLETTEDKD